MTFLFLTTFCIFAGGNANIEALVANNPFESGRQATNAAVQVPLDPVVLTPDSSEEQVSLYLRQNIVREGEQAGVMIRSLNLRKSRLLDEATGSKELNIYFGYDADLEALAHLFESLNHLGIDVGLKNLTISARRRPASVSPEQSQRKPLNGNAIISVIWPLQETPEDAEFAAYGSSLPAILNTLTNYLPGDTYLTHVQIKNGDELTLQGESDEPFDVQRSLASCDILSDVRTGGAITSGKNRDGKRRFMYKATIIHPVF